MNERRRAWRVGAIAAVLVILGVVLLGTRWDSVEVAPGRWQDAIPLARWSVFWGAVFAAGLPTGRLLPSWGSRALATVPLLLWFALELRSGTLAPLAWLIYGGTTFTAWLAGCGLGGLIGRRWHAP